MTYLNNVSKTKLIAHIAAAVAAVLMAAIGISVYGADVSALCLFVLFMLVYVMVPGYAIIRLLGIDTPHLSTVLALSLYSGWGLNVLMYFIADLLHASFLLAAAGPLIAICWLVYAYTAKRSGSLKPASFSAGRSLAELPLSFCIFFVIVLAYALLSTQYQYMAPDLSASIILNPDKAYHMGLVDSLSHDYPLQSPWIQGRYISYHIFTEVLYSIPVRFFNMEADFLLLSCGPYLTTFAICTSMYSFFAELTRKPERAGIYCLLVMLANPYIARNIYKSIAFKFIITNDNTSGYGVMAAMAFVVLLKYWFKAYDKRGGRIPPAMTVLLTAFLMLVSGIKGPMGIVLISAFWGTLFLGWILRSCKFNLIVPALSMSAGFVIVYVTVLGAKGRGTATGGNSLISFGDITNVSFWKEPMTEWLKAASVPYPARLLILLAVFMIFYLTAYLLPFIVGYLRELYVVLTKKKAYVFYEVIVYASFLVGFTAMFFLRYSGHSQIYFGLLSLFFAPLIAYWYLEDALPRLSSGQMTGARAGLFKAMLGISALMLVYTSIMLAVSFDKMVPGAISHTDRTREYNLYTSMSNAEWQAMEWIEDNTPDDALLATDRYYSVAPEKWAVDNRWANRFFLYAAYSNRFCYIAGSGYNLGTSEWPIRLEMIKKNRELYDPGNEARGDTARELGIDYVVLSKRFTDVPSLQGSGYDLCYKNSDIEIYEVKDAS